MRSTALTVAALLFVGWCAACQPGPIKDADIQAFATTANLQTQDCSTMVNKAWQASADKDYPALFAYTQECVRRHSEEAKQMNDALGGFAPDDEAAKHWALNDVGTALFIMGHAYADLGMHQEAAQTFQTLADDYQWTQCWDPKGWYWHPAQGAADKALKHRHLAR